MGWRKIACSGLLLSALAGAQTLNCEFQHYKALDGLKAEMRSGSLELTWQSIFSSKDEPETRGEVIGR
jgi:hypothetical protein